MTKISAILFVVVVFGLATAAQAEPANQSNAKSGKLTNPALVPHGTFDVTVKCGKEEVLEQIQDRFYPSSWFIEREDYPNAPSTTKCKEGERITVRFFRFASKEKISRKEIVRNMARKGCRPANIWHLLAFGAANPKYVKQFWISALGDQWQCDSPERGTPVLVDYYPEYPRSEIDVGLCHDPMPGDKVYLAVCN